MGAGMTLEEAVVAGVPYFGPELQANQGDNHFRHFPAICALARRPGEPLDVLEVGSWAGNSLVAWARAAGPDSLLTAVDAWQPYLPAGSSWPHYDVMSGAAASGWIETLFRHNVRASGVGPGRVAVRKGDSRDVLRQLEPGSFDVAFVDGDHRYKIVREDIALCKALVRVGGILCGDDLDQQLGDLDAAEHAEVMAVDEEVATNRSGVCYHHGVVQAVHDHFGRVTCFETRLWAVRKTADGWENVPAELAP